MARPTRRCRKWTCRPTPEPRRRLGTTTIPVSASDGQITIAFSGILRQPINQRHRDRAGQLDRGGAGNRHPVRAAESAIHRVPARRQQPGGELVDHAGQSRLHRLHRSIHRPRLDSRGYFGDDHASSTTNSNILGTAVVSLSPTDPSSFTALRINAGGPTLSTRQPRVDGGHGLYHFLLRQRQYVFLCTPAGLDGEYGTLRWCDGSSPQITYQIPVPNMEYLVTLKFAEPNVSWGPGARIFSVAVNGQTNSALSQVDVSANAGATQKAWDATIPVSVSNGQITIALSAIQNWPIIDAIEIAPANSLK